MQICSSCFAEFVRPPPLRHGAHRRSVTLQNAHKLRCRKFVSICLQKEYMPKPTSFQPCYSSSIAPNPCNQGSTIKITLIIYTLSTCIHTRVPQSRKRIGERRSVNCKFVLLFCSELVRPPPLRHVTHRCHCGKCAQTKMQENSLQCV